MKEVSVIAAMLIVAGSALAAETTYHFNVYVFDTKPMQESRAVGEGKGDPEVCKDLFSGPLPYNGPYIQIGTNATVLGVVAVTDGKTSKIIPLFKWTDQKGKVQCGCNGPTPRFAKLEESEDALLKSITETIRQK